MALFIFFSILLGSGIIFVLFRFIRNLIRCTVKVDAVICEIIYLRYNLWYSRPVYQFFYEGEEYQVQKPYGTRRYSDLIGTQVILRIDPKNPKVFSNNLLEDLVDTISAVFGFSVFLLFNILMIYLWVSG